MHSLNGYADDIVLKVETERKLEELLQKLVKKSKKKGLAIN